MNRLKITGWRLDNLDSTKLALVLATVKTQPAIRETALLMLAGHPLIRDWKPTAASWYRGQARKLVRSIILENPEAVGAERIDPDKISKVMSSRELAEFCMVPIKRVQDLAGESPENGLPRPDWPLGRTLKGRGWRFKPDVARQYAERLLKEE